MLLHNLYDRFFKHKRLFHKELKWNILTSIERYQVTNSVFWWCKKHLCTDRSKLRLCSSSVSYFDRCLMCLDCLEKPQGILRVHYSFDQSSWTTKYQPNTVSNQIFFGNESGIILPKTQYSNLPLRLFFYVTSCQTCTSEALQCST